MTRQPEQQQQRAMSPSQPPPCPGCKRTMRLVGRENDEGSNTDRLTFECECGQMVTTLTNQ